MIWGVVLLLVAALIGIPLSVALTGTTAALGAMAGLVALVGVRTRSASGLTVAVAFGLLQELVALVQAGKPPVLWSAVLLDMVVYLLLDIGAFAARFHGVAVDGRVWRMQVMYWGGTAVLFGCTGLAVGLLAAVSARPFTGPLLLHGLAVVAAVMVVGAVFGAIRIWYHEGGAL
jgi:hypothetical protein